MRGGSHLCMGKSCEFEVQWLVSEKNVKQLQVSSGTPIATSTDRQPFNNNHFLKAH